MNPVGRVYLGANPGPAQARRLSCLGAAPERRVRGGFLRKLAGSDTGSPYRRVPTMRKSYTSSRTLRQGVAIEIE